MGNRFFLSFFTILLSFSSYAVKPLIFIAANGKSEVCQFAQQEIKKFLSDNYEFTDGTADWQIVLLGNEKLTGDTFRVEYKSTNNGQQIILSGSNETSMLHAVYTFLEKAGIRFELSGPVFEGNANLDRLKGYSETITPKVKQRGIRQHINFTMDISSYPLEEAKEYVRNLARLRFNFITFHSYPGQWYEDPANNKDPYAGNFFYGKRHDIPDEKFFHETIRNKKTYCIPEIEPFFDDKPTRSKMAINWLREVITECKRVGLTVRFSFEPRGTSPTIQTTIETVKKILTYYPMIDELEIITSETAHVSKQLGMKEVSDLLIPLYGQEVLNDAVVMKPIGTGSSGVAELFAQIGHNIKALDSINGSLLKPRGINGSLGLYVATPEYLEASYHLLRKFAPNTSYAVLPGHGSTRVARFLPYTGMEKRDWGKTMIYSWLEFDGLMYLQQNGIRGIRNLIELGEDINGSDQIQSICFNHWRTAENKITARYASEATLYGAIDECSFYSDYAKCYGIEKREDFTKAMKQIDEATWFATNELPNVGFCYALGSNSAGFGFLGNLEQSKLKQGRELYQRALDLIISCSNNVKSKEGQKLLALLDNRLRATILYLNVFEKGADIQQFNKDHLSGVEKEKIALILNKSISGFEQYLKLYSGIMPDRGSEGTIISAYYVRIDVLKRIRENICGIPYGGIHPDEKPIDAPPPPINK